jgi:hypothetical protein
VKGFWSSVRTTIARPARQLVYAGIPGPGAEVGGWEPVLNPHEGYVRVWLSQLFLARKSTLLSGWVPAAHARVAVSVAGRTTHEFGRVLRPDPDAMADGVRLNFPLSDLLPYEGGDVEVEAALIGLRSGNHLDVVVDLLSMVSALPVPGLDVAVKVSTGVRDLVTRSDGAVHLNLHETLTAAGGGGSPVRSQYRALVLASHEQLASERLRVVDERLHQLDGGTVVPLEGYDFMLLRVECRADRPDYWLPEIEELWTKAVGAYRDADTHAAEGYQRAACAAALGSPLLTRVDRRRLIEAIASQWELLSDRGHGVAGGAVPESVTELMRQWAPTVQEAAARGPITANEAFAR